MPELRHGFAPGLLPLPSFHSSFSGERLFDTPGAQGYNVGLLASFPDDKTFGDYRAHPDHVA
jgi:hypothetical protein